MSTRQVKPTYSPVPLRAYRDAELTALDLRVLAAIAAHDRFNANGQACWASNERLAEIGGCHVKSVPRSIRRLLERGYLKDLGAKPGKQRSRSRFLTVIYNEHDAAAFQTPTAKQPDSTNEAPAERPPAAVADSPSAARRQPSGYLEGNPAVTLREKGRYYAEALGSAVGLMQQPSAPTDPPHALRTALGRRADAQRDAARLLGKGDLTKGFELLSAIPDAKGRRRYG
jgi:hypothetical protein